MENKIPQHLAAAVILALALSFAAGVTSAGANPSAQAEAAQADSLVADLIASTPFDYFPGHYQNPAKEIEPLPPQF